MVFKERWVGKVVFAFKKAIEQKIEVKQFIIFGSFAYGNPTSHSDLDIAVISKDFDGMSDIERIMFLTNIARKISVPFGKDIDPVGFTPSELKNAGYFNLASEIRDKGKKVA